MKQFLPGRRDKSREDRSRANGGFVSIEELNRKKSVQSKRRPTLRGLGQNRRDTRTFSTLSRSAVDDSPSSPLNDGATTFSHFNTSTPAHPSSAVNSRSPSFHESSQYPSNPRPRTADAATFELARSRSKTDAVSPAVTTAPWVDKPLPLLVDNGRLANVQAHGEAMIDAAGRFVTGPVRPRTASGVVENQPRRARTDILPGTRPPYTLVPPISTNFDHIHRFSYAAHSPISRHSSRDNTPRGSLGTPTSQKNPAVRNSILDEVEGSLTATLRDFQGLQEFLHHDSPPITPDQVFGPPPLYQPNDLLALQRRASSTALHPADSYFAPQQAPPPSWDASQMAAVVQQQQAAFAGANGGGASPQTPMRSVGSLTGEFDAYDPKLLAVQHAYEEQKKAAHALQLENDNGKRRLEFLRARLSEFESEKSNLIKAAKDAEEKMQITLTKLQQARSAEITAQKEFAAAQNKVSVLDIRVEEEKKKSMRLTDELEGEKETVEKVQAKLEEANGHKVDLLEREWESRKEIIVTKKKLKKAVDELNAIKRKERNSAVEEKRKTEQDAQNAELERLRAAQEERRIHDEKQNGELQTQNELLAALRSELESSQHQLSESTKQNTTLQAELQKRSPQLGLPSRLAEMTFRVEALEAELSDRDSEIQALAQPTISLCPPSPTSSVASPITARNSNEIDDMRRMMEVMDKARKDVVADRDRLAGLLLAEMRRVAVDENDRRHPSEGFFRGKPELESAVAVVRERARTYLKENGMAGANGEDAEGMRRRVTELEKEIEYYLNDIVLYKLDVKGYKKDLRKAEKKLRELNEHSPSGDGRVSTNGINGTSGTSRSHTPPKHTI